MTDNILCVNICLSKILKQKAGNIMKQSIEDFNKFYDKRDIFHEYLAFSQFFQRAFISEDGYIINTGNFETVNREMIDLVYKRIKKHPILWRLFFMIG